MINAYQRTRSLVSQTRQVFAPIDFWALCLSSDSQKKVVG